MGKYRGRISKVVECEPTIIRTRQGPRLVDRALPSTPSVSSRNSSPSKKRAFSPGFQYDEDGLPNGSGPSPAPKRSRTSGTVGYHLKCISPLNLMIPFESHDLLDTERMVEAIFKDKTVSDVRNHSS
jgi:hypothetical protein